MKKEERLINYFNSLGLTVNTTTKARGHLGFCLKNRIDISKNIDKDKRVQVLLHEFSHYIHSKIESDVNKTGGSLEKLFLTEATEIFRDELLGVTKFIDENSKCQRLNIHKKSVKEKILELEKVIKERYPKFLRSKRFKEFDKYIKKTNAKYLLKYDRVRVYSWFLLKQEIYSIENLERDFPEMPKEFAAYIRLKSMQRKQKRISSRINKLRKYYEKPTELFARFVESYYTFRSETLVIAPNVMNRFEELLLRGYYGELKEALEIVE